MATKRNIDRFASDGSEYVTITDGSGNIAVSGVSGPLPQTGTSSDAVATSVVGQYVNDENLVFNGGSWDRMRSLGGYSNTASTGVLVAVTPPSGIAAAGLTANQTTVVGSSQVVKGSSCNLYSLSCTSGASAGFVLVFDATTPPADGTVTPIDVITIAANATVTKNYPIPLRCNSGATLVFSTTGPFTKTASATAFLMGQAV